VGYPTRMSLPARQIRLVTSAATSAWFDHASAVIARPTRVAAEVRRRTRTMRLPMRFANSEWLRVLGQLGLVGNSPGADPLAPLAGRGPG
jgi:hypothetical protein